MANQVGKVQAEIVLKFDQLRGSVDKAVATIGTMNKKITAQAEKGAKDTEKAWQQAFAVLSVLAVSTARKVNRAFGSMVQTFATFEQSLANTQSVAQASAKELDEMEKAARRVGATTRSTASQAANALYFLASAGFSAAEAIAALDGVNALAIATQSDLAKTSEVVAVTIRQYNLETSAATDIANIFTAAITNSLATMNKLAKAFEFVGPIAAGLGLTVEETTGALQVLFNKGFSGEKAGRGLRTILVNLADSTSVVTRRLERLGITFDQINPTINTLAEIFDTLRENEVDATNAAAIFGKVSGVQLASLIAQSSDAKGGIIEMTEAITGTNRALEAMAIQMDTLQGSIDKFKNATEALQISTGKGLEPTLRAIVDTATEFVKLLDQVPSGVLAVGATVGALAINATALGFALKTAALFFGKLGFAIALAIPPVGTLIGIIAAITAGLILLVKASNTFRKISFEKMDEKFGDIAESAGIADENLRSFFKISQKISQLVSFIKKSDIQDAQSLKNELNKLAKAFSLTTSQVLEIAKSNDAFIEKAGISVAILENELRLEKELADLRSKDTVDAISDRQKYTNAYLEGSRQLDVLEEKLAVSVQNTAEAYQSLTLAFQRAIEQQKAFGDEFDRNKTLTDAFADSILLLIKQGLKFESDEVQNLISLYEELQVLYGKVLSKEEQLTEEQKRAQKSLEIYQKRLKDTSIKLESYGKTELQVLEIRREAALEGIDILSAEGKAIDTYFDKLVELQKLKASVDANEKAIDLTDTYKDSLQRLGATELELIEINRKKAIEEAILLDISTKAYLELVEAINELFDAQKKIAEDTVFIASLERNFETVADFSDAIGDLIVASIDRQIEAEERLLEVKLKALDEAERAALISAGVLEKTALEKAQIDLATAISTGDAIKTKEAQDLVDRLTIQEEFDAKRLKLETEAAKELAELKYKAELSAWLADGISALANAASAIIHAYNIPGIGLAAGTAMIGLTGLQLGTHLANAPIKPKFQNSGIVPGSSFKGDTTPVLANAGELILDRGKQQNIANQLDQNNQPIDITTNIVLDGKVVATNSARYYNNGQVKLR